MSNFISKVYIGAAGDTSVGIPSTTIEIDLQLDVDNYDGQREDIRLILENAFVDILDEPVKVAFEDEVIT